MIISNGIDHHFFNSYEINYIKLIDKTLTFYKCDNTDVQIVFSDEENLTNEIDSFVKAMHTVLATCGAGTTGSVTSGIIYWINCKNANTVALDTSQVDITFKDESTLNIVFENSTEAEREYEYIMFCYKNADIKRFVHNKRVLKINPAYTTNVSLKQFKTYTEARANSTSGDVIWFEDCVYTTGTERFDLKNGVDIVFYYTIVKITLFTTWNTQGGNIGKALFTDDVETVTTYILGSLTVHYEVPNSQGGWLVIDTKRSGTMIFIAFKEMLIDTTLNNITSWVHALNTVRIWVKGYKMIDSRIYDDDSVGVYPNGHPISCDYDVLYCTPDTTDGFMYLPYSAFCNWRIRNIYSEGLYNTDFNEGGSYRFINCKFVDGGFATNLSGTPLGYFKIWRCFFNLLHAISTDTIDTVDNYNQSFGTKADTVLEAQTLPYVINDYSSVYIAGRLPEGIGSIQQLNGIVSDDKFIMQSSNVTNAKFYEVFKDDVLYDTIPTLFGEDFYYEYQISNNDIHTFKIRAYA